jgi:hypothetical protein
LHASTFDIRLITPEMPEPPTARPQTVTVVRVES